MSKWLSKLDEDFGILAELIPRGEGSVFPTPSPSLNWAMGIGGFRAGKISVLYGPESAGKTTLALLAIIEMQRRDPEGVAMWFDAEFSFNLNLFLKLGGDPKRLLVKKTNDPEKIFDFLAGPVLEKLQEGFPLRAFAIDSIKSLHYPKEKNKKKTTDFTMGGTGSQYLPSAIKLVLPIIAEYKLMTLLIQQVTMQIDPMKALRNPYVITEGMALKHAADVMLEIIKLDTKKGVVENGETIAGGAQQTGHKVRVKVKKNRMGAPNRVAQFTFDYERGVIDQGSEVFELAKSLGVIYHPINPETGKANPQMWQILDQVVRKEETAKATVVASSELQGKLMDLCFAFKQADVKSDTEAARAGIIDEDDVDALENLTMEDL